MLIQTTPSLDLKGDNDDRINEKPRKTTHSQKDFHHVSLAETLIMENRRIKVSEVAIEFMYPLVVYSQ
ncbi:hypothetical protein J6590_038722 [Homalodisca vitripennis]|nr:hypothetical protein J6590_038722 [Homalodisca vitripennis]